MLTASKVVRCLFRSSTRSFVEHVQPTSNYYVSYFVARILLSTYGHVILYEILPFDPLVRIGILHALAQGFCFRRVCWYWFEIVQSGEPTLLGLPARLIATCLGHQLNPVICCMHPELRAGNHSDVSRPFLSTIYTLRPVFERMDQIMYKYRFI